MFTGNSSLLLEGGVSVVSALISGFIAYNKASKDKAVSDALTNSKIDEHGTKIIALELKQSKIEQMASDIQSMKTDISWIKGTIGTPGFGNHTNE